jgi:cytochrome P450
MKPSACSMAGLTGGLANEMPYAHPILRHLLALLGRPGQWRSQQAGVVDIGRAVEDLRWTRPVGHVRRTAQADTALGGAAIRAGDAAAVWLPSLNPDETVIEAGARLLLGCSAQWHMTVSVRVRFCLEAIAARLTLGALLAELVADGTEVELAGRLRRLASCVLPGPARRPVTIRGV